MPRRRKTPETHPEEFCDRCGTLYGTRGRVRLVHPELAYLECTVCESLPIHSSPVKGSSSKVRSCAHILRSIGWIRAEEVSR